jgi:hypothetical protein
VPLLTKLKEAAAELEAPDDDPWLATLARVRGKVDFDGQERVSSQTVLDVLQVPQRSPYGRHLSACGETDGGAGVGCCAGP